MWYCWLLFFYARGAERADAGAEQTPRRGKKQLSEGPPDLNEPVYAEFLD